MQLSRSTSIIAALGIAAFIATAAQAQAPSTEGLLKGKVKPGLYEQKATWEMTGMGLAPGQGKSTETKTECVTADDIESGEFTLQEGCTVKSVQRTATGAQIKAACKDGGMAEISIAAASGGFRMDMKSAGKGPDGKPFAMTLRTDAKYVGACKEE